MYLPKYLSLPQDLTPTHSYKIKFYVPKYVLVAIVGSALKLLGLYYD